MSLIRDEEDKKKYRKALIVMLYSHYEGFCKTAFLIYIKAINEEGINRKDANQVIKTASLSEVFKAYGNFNKKNDFFKRDLPNDEKLHLFSRQIDFVEMIDKLWNEKVTISEKIVDTESNLKPVVMRKILYRLGFQHDCFSMYEGNIHKLLNKRNQIAHGSNKRGIEERDYNEVELSSFKIMDELKRLIIESLDNNEFLKTAN